MQDTHHERRRRFLSAMGDKAVAVLPAAPVAVRNNDVEHEYRQDSDLFYLTGLAEPESVLILSNVHDEHESVLFVRPRNPEREIWDGPRVGVEEAKERFGVDATFEIGELPAKLAGYLTRAQNLYFRLDRDPEMDRRVLRALSDARRQHRHGWDFPSAVVNPGRHLHELRLVKDEGEIATMRRAAAITDEAHRAAMQVALPGAYEFEVEAEILRVFRKSGCERPAYGSIVGSGPNATILHHRTNDRKMLDGDLLLIDAGCEYQHYASDVTRTFPVNGKFSPEQRAIYELVLAAQKASLAEVTPGATLKAIHNAAARTITEGLIELGLVEGPPEKAFEEDLYKPFYMHRTSHWLGMDVHDVGLYFTDGEPRLLKPGFVLTVEPGIYIGVNAEVDAKWRGIGVRIEDDVLVTPDGHDNLTASIPKDPDEIERFLHDR